MDEEHVENIIARVDPWQGKSVEFKPLPGGITNHNYTVFCNGDKYVLRIPGSGSEKFIDRNYELSCSIAAAKSGVSPEVVCAVKPENAMVIPYIEGEVMHPEIIAADDYKVEAITRAIKQVHDHAVFESEFNIFDIIRDYVKMADEAGAFLPHDFDWMRNITDRIEKALEHDPLEPVACHNDLLSENFIFDENGKVWILDWEYGGMGDPYFDLGDFAVEHPLSRDQEKLIIETYCGKLDQRRFSRMMLHKLTADLWWSVWAMIQNEVSKIDFDFYIYGIRRQERFRRNFYEDDFEKRLGDVR